MSVQQRLETKASGRLCLLGEHADYLGLEVISFPLDLYLGITAEPIPGTTWSLELQDLGIQRTIDPTQPIVRVGANDYIAAGFQRILAAGGRFENAYRVRVNSTIPIGKGVSSSSAFCVAWMDLLHRAATPSRILTDADLAEEAYRLEVLDFQQSGGMQDHYTIAYGRLIHLDCRGPVGVQPLSAPMEGFVLGDSGVEKDTQGVLSRIRGTVEGALAKLGWQKDALRNVAEADVLQSAAHLEDEEREVLLATVSNREQCRRGAALLDAPLEDEARQLQLGQLLREHHHHLKTRLRTSTDRIDLGLKLADDAGALGGKVLGSGAGGCFLIYAPGKTDQVVAALEAGGFKARPVSRTAGSGRS